jgi:hypothetical protein
MNALKKKMYRMIPRPRQAQRRESYLFISLLSFERTTSSNRIEGKDVVPAIFVEPHTDHRTAPTKRNNTPTTMA